MPRYLLTIADKDARDLENWLGGGLQIVPGAAVPAGIPIAGLDAVTDHEASPIVSRLASGSPAYEVRLARRSSASSLRYLAQQLRDHGNELYQRAAVIVVLETMADETEKP